MSETLLYVIWRIDGEFELTDLPVRYRDLNTDELVKICIRKESEDDDDSIEYQIQIATNSDHKDFQGYEMPAIFVSADVEFIQT
jgi:hypothetical protein